MGDGKRLKEILDEKGTNVRKLAKATFINASTLYAIIQKDSNIRFDWALRIANELDIDVHEICSATPFSGEVTEDEIYPTLKVPRLRRQERGPLFRRSEGEKDVRPPDRQDRRQDPGV